MNKKFDLSYYYPESDKPVIVEGTIIEEKANTYIVEYGSLFYEVQIIGY